MRHLVRGTRSPHLHTPDNPLNRELVVSIRASLNRLSLQRSIQGYVVAIRSRAQAGKPHPYTNCLYNLS